MTDKEYKILHAIVTSEYQDGSDDGSGDVIGHSVWTKWLNIPSDLIKSGVFSSLVKKGYIGIMHDQDGDRCWITEKGYKAYKEVKKWF